MIEAMSKLGLIIHHKKVDEFLKSLQKIGVVHIEEKQFDHSVFIEDEKLKIRIKNFLKLCDQTIGRIGAVRSLRYEGNVEDLLNEVESLQHRIDELNSDGARLKKLYSELMPWGEFEFRRINELKQFNVFVKFFVLAKDQFEKWDKQKYRYEIINEFSGKVYFVVLYRNQEELVDLKFTETFLPDIDSINCVDLISKNLEELNSLKAKLDKVVCYREYALNFYNNLEDYLSFGHAKQSLDCEYEELKILTGFVPIDSLDKVKKLLDRTHGIVYNINNEINDEDLPKVPIKLKNNWFNKLFEPITLLFSLPTYKELDLTPFFAPFFFMFFGICLGDSGYGVLMFCALTFAFFKFKKMRPLITLGLFLSASTIFWGTLTGTCFGVDLFKEKVPFLSDWAVFTSAHMFYLALMIGLFQILFGMLVQAFNRARQNGILAGLSPIGWIILVIFVTFTYLGTQPVTGDFKLGLALLNLSHSVPKDVNTIGMSVGVILILLFNDVKANIFIRFGKGMWELYGITGVFGDLLSYIRLFALGISSAILGNVINSIGGELLKTNIPVLSHVLFFGFLAVGHVCNTLLASLGSFVHPLRLTFVEFYKNAGFSGGGKPYNPFKQLSNELTDVIKE